MVSPRNEVWEMSVEFYSDDASQPRCGYCFWLVEANFPWGTTSRKHYPDWAIPHLFERLFLISWENNRDCHITMPLSLKTMEVKIKGDHWNRRFRIVQVYSPDLASDASSVWNFCACFSDFILQGNQWLQLQNVSCILRQTDCLGSTLHHVRNNGWLCNSLKIPTNYSPLG